MAKLEALRNRIESLYGWTIRSWMPAVAVVLFAFASATLRLDDYPIQADGLLSISTVGYGDPGADLTSIFERLAIKSQQHVPAYFLTLFAWGKLSAWSLLGMRLLTVFFGALSLALMYRLARDFISKEAGIYAIIMLASLYFYNIFYLPIRMYTMFVATELLLLWLYFRTLRHPSPAPSHYLALGLAALLFAYTHIFSVALFFGLTLYHLVFIDKTRRWLAITAIAAVVTALILPWLLVFMPGTALATTRAEMAFGHLTVGETFETIIRLGINGNVFFFLPLLLAALRLRQRQPMNTALWVIGSLTISVYLLINGTLQLIDIDRSRYFVIIFPLIILLVVIGTLQFQRWRWLTVAILLFWVASGLLFQRRVGPGFFVRSYDTIPIHLIERHLRDQFQAGDLLTGWSNGLDFRFRSSVYGGVIDIYFADHDIDIAILHNNNQLSKRSDEQIIALLGEITAARQRVWLAYELDNIERYQALFHSSLAASYQLCLRDSSINNVSLELYQPACL